MLTKVHTGLEPVPGIWWRPAHKAEKIWVGIAFAWCMVLFAMMPLWHYRGGQNPAGVRTRVDPKAFYARTVEFANQYKIGEDRGLPIVQPPPGADVYLVGTTFSWYPILQLQAGGGEPVAPVLAAQVGGRGTERAHARGPGARAFEARRKAVRELRRPQPGRQRRQLRIRQQHHAARRMRGLLAQAGVDARQQIGPAGGGRRLKVHAGGNHRRVSECGFLSQ